MSLSPVYRVHKGDSLWSIAQLFRTSVAEIKQRNKLRASRIYPGQLLVVGPEIKEIPAPNGPYYFHKPKRKVQKSSSYVERSPRSPRNDYRSAKKILRSFEAEVSLEAGKHRDGKRLKGWRIVLDPGHGGIDPGAIVSNKDGNNHMVYVVEDEYVYDIALRMYKQLRMIGAEVELTVVSPNHLTRDNLQANVTFVHESNEIYNDERVNRKNSESVRPGGHNLDKRVAIANRFFKGARGKTLFVSLHADNSPERPKGPLTIYLNRKGKVDKRSRAFARVMQKSLDQKSLPAQISGRNLAVLRKNRATAEILVEIRNVSDIGEAWALRDHKNRQKDAERMVEGILKYAGR